MTSSEGRDDYGRRGLMDNLSRLNSPQQHSSGVWTDVAS